MSSNEKFKYPDSMPVIDGIVLYEYTTRVEVQRIANLELRDDDVFLTAYPKSGQTWTIEIVKQVLNGGEFDQESPLICRAVYLDAFSCEKRAGMTPMRNYETVTDFAKSLPSPRILKTHLQYHLVPRSDGCTAKYIYNIRNPKDVAVSYYYHHRTFKEYCFQEKWNDFFEMMMSGQVQYGSWFDHVLDWWEHRDDPNILLLKYEDMKKDHRGAVAAIAKFLGRALTEEQLDRIVSQTSFEFMKSQEPFKVKEPFKNPNEPNFIRKGVVGDWRNHFTAEQNKMFDELYETRMAGKMFDIEF
ncbi:sulfotransferase 1B1 [Nematostella vectensis]|uniref:sulfotransferase 1B1 n=1 Tax=Nematostella vectensis TaxID=45351 RepID=UPI00207782AD|nr:sulfotransferase 1B1 [Nematostella vectensis]